LNEKYELDHIKPVSGGGTNERNNLQMLCVSCHKEKCSEEHSEYIKQNEFSSCLNIQASKLLDDKFSRKVAFSHFIKDEDLDHYKYHFEDDYKNNLYSIDINGCRRNIMKYSMYDFPKYSVLDNWEVFDGVIEDGNYYVETDNYELFHKNGIYSRPIIEYGLEQNIITKENIKYQFKCSSIVDKKIYKILFVLYGNSLKEQVIKN
jgi:hypothetical protein